MSVIVDEPVTLQTASDSIVCNSYAVDVDGVEYWAEVDGWGAAGVRNSTYDRTAADGAEQGAWFAGVREVTINGHHLATTEAGRLAADRRLIAAVWRKPVTVIVGDVQATGWVDSRPELDTLGCAAEWQIVVLCTDPAKYAVTPSTITLAQAGAPTAGLHWDTLHWGPTSGGLHWGTGGLSTLQGVALNAGTERSYPTLTITGPAVNPALTNGLTGAFLRFVTTLTATDTITVDTATNAVMLGGSSWFHTLDPVGGLPSDFYLQAGANPIYFGADTLGTGAQATVSWRSAIV
jgi:hypothetical protein